VTIMQTNFDDFRDLFSRNFVELWEGFKSPRKESSTKFRFERLFEVTEKLELSYFAPSKFCLIMGGLQMTSK